LWTACFCDDDDRWGFLTSGRRVGAGGIVVVVVVLVVGPLLGQEAGESVDVTIDMVVLVVVDVAAIMILRASINSC
jgi:hypothetical protein